MENWKSSLKKAEEVSSYLKDGTTIDEATKDQIPSERIEIPEYRRKEDRSPLLIRDSDPNDYRNQTNNSNSSTRISERFEVSSINRNKRKSFPFNRNKGNACRSFKKRSNNNYKKKQWKHYKQDVRYRRKHLKDLRRIAAMNMLNNRSFVYKPGMINILRPNTPRNTTRFLAKINSNRKTPNAAKLWKKNSLESRKIWFSLKDDLSELAVSTFGLLPKTPVISIIDKLNLNNDINSSSSKHITEEWDWISGTMEGLVDSAFFDIDNQINSPTKSELQQSTPIQISLSDSTLCSWIYRSQWDLLKLKWDNLSKILIEKDSYIQKLENHLSIYP